MINALYKTRQPRLGKQKHKVKKDKKKDEDKGVTLTAWGTYKSNIVSNFAKFGCCLKDK